MEQSRLSRMTLQERGDEGGAGPESFLHRHSSLSASQSRMSLLDVPRLPGEPEADWQRRRSASLSVSASQGRVSDVEMTRGMALGEGGGRTSISASAGRRSSISFIDDENVPAFEEHVDMYPGAQPQMGEEQYDYAYEQPDYMMDVEVRACN